MRLRIEALRARLEGKTGLRRHAERLKRGHPRQQPAETSGAASASQRISPERLRGVFSYLESLSVYYPDQGIGNSLRTRLHSLTERMRGNTDG
jgi:hypothetical protein